MRIPMLSRGLFVLIAASSAFGCSTLPPTATGEGGPVARAEMPADEFAARLREVRRAYLELSGEQAHLLAPLHFGRLEEEVKQAESKADSDALRRAERIAGPTRDATRAARELFDDALNLREEALREGATALDEFRSADERFVSISGQVERGLAARNPGEVNDLGQELAARYSELRTRALQVRWLADARSMISAARDQGAPEIVPRTFAAAEAIVARSAGEIAESPDDVEVVQKAAERARFAGLRLLSILDLAGTVDQLGPERSAWWFEEQLDLIARTLNVPDLRDQPAEGKIAILASAIRQVWEDRQFFADAARGSFWQPPGGQALPVRIQRAEKLLSGTGTKVKKTRDGMVIRLEQIGFQPGDARISPRDIELLSRLERALELFRGGTVLIRAHSAASADVNYNRMISDRRARAMLAHLNAGGKSDRWKVRVDAKGHRPGGNEPVNWIEIQVSDAAHGTDDKRLAATR